MRRRVGFSFLPQGRPTNNVEGESAAYSWQEDPDVSFDHYFGAEPPDASTGYAKTDGRRFAEILGLSAEALRGIPFYGRTDVGDALAMNSALWPATLGYFMDSMLHPVFDDSTVQRTREFFTDHVLARGPLPAIRVGKQPYGILPATVRSRMEWLFDGAVDRTTGAAGAAFFGGEVRHLQGLYTLLRKVEADLEPLLAKVSFVGKSGDQHQVLLDVIGLHAGIGGVRATLRGELLATVQPAPDARRRRRVSRDPDLTRLRAKRHSTFLRSSATTPSPPRRRPTSSRSCSWRSPTG